MPRIKKKEIVSKLDEREREWVIFLAKFLSLKKVEDIVILKLNKENYVVDYFVIGTIQTADHSLFIVRELDSIVEKLNMLPLNREGVGKSGWTVLTWDFCALHLFTKNLREYYNIEDLWIDAKKIYWKNAKLKIFPHPRILLSPSLSEQEQINQKQ